MPGITHTEFGQRRVRVLRALKGAAGVVFAGDGSAPLVGKWRCDTSFAYLTGIVNEPGAVVLFDPAAEDPKRRIVLYLAPVDPEAERWDGYRDRIGEPLRAKTGFETVRRSGELPRALTTAARRTGRLACLHQFAVYPGRVSPDLAVFRSVQERVAGVGIEDRTQLVASLRAIKSRAEASLMRRAAAATAAGFAEACRVIRPGVTERAVQEALERTYVASGASGVAYNSIVGSGISGTVLHYSENSGTLAEGDLLVIDSGAELGGYAADVTRTYPVSGRFTREQRELYEVVLRAQRAGIGAARPGARWWQVDAAARAIIEKAGLGDAYIHGIGHQLGIEVHDASPDGPLKAGMVVTIEPGVYLPERKIGIRIEDDVQITARGNVNLTASIPKEPADVEACLGAGAGKGRKSR